MKKIEREKREKQIKKEAGQREKKYLAELSDLLKDLGFTEERDLHHGRPDGPYDNGPIFKSGPYEDPEYIEISGLHLQGTAGYSKDWFTLWGEVTYRAGDSCYRFGRRGIDSGISFDEGLSNEDSKLPTPQELIEWIFDEASQRRERILGSVDVQIGHATFKIAPERVEQYKKELKTEGFIRIMPAGMGTGYTVSATKPKHPYQTGKLSDEMAKLFGKKVLYFEGFDCD